MSANWIAVACAEHVGRGRASGFMQICHGKAAPLRRLQPGDRVVYYSPTERMGDRAPLQAFTAIGILRDGVPYQHDMGGGFRPYRRDVTWFDAEPAAIKPLLSVLDFASGQRNWGYQLRFGLFAVSDHDLSAIAAAMGADPG